MSQNNNHILEYYYGFDEKPIDIRRKCETDYHIKDGNLVEFNKGAYGSVSEVCKKSKCNYIVKAMPINETYRYESFLREALIGPLMAKNKIGPIIHDIFICLNTGFIVTERWRGSIKKIIKYLNNDDYLNIGNLISKMHNIGVIHNDLHGGNILYNIVNNKYEFSITDFGLSLYFENKDSVIPDKFIPNSYSPNIFFPAFDYHRFSINCETKIDKIFFTFFIKNKFISISDYLIVDKFLNRPSQIQKVNFSKFLKKLNLNNLSNSTTSLSCNSYSKSNSKKSNLKILNNTFQKMLESKTISKKSSTNK